MAGGLMQLVVIRAHAVYLTGNPQITFFKTVYRRHTNFSKECIAQKFNNSFHTTNESSVSCTLEGEGDLVQEIYLKTTVATNPVSDDLIDLGTCTVTRQSGGGWKCRISNFVSIPSPDAIVYFDQDIKFSDEFTLVKNSNVKIRERFGGPFYNRFTLNDMDGNQLDVVAGEFTTNYVNLKMRQDITILNNVDMTNLIKTVEIEIGDQKIDKHYSQWLDIYNELFETRHDYRFAMTNGSQRVPNINTKTHYIPLRFWFNRNPGLALPLIALQYHEVKINMTLDPTRGKGWGTGGVTMNEAELLVNYIYLDTDERRRFTQVSHEYLIEQVQHTGVETEGPIDMNFNHPVKALFWTAGANPGNVKLQLNGHDRAVEQSHDYYHLVQPYECGLGHSGKSLDNAARTWGPVVNTADTQCVGMYSFCLKPAEHQPSGTCNFSRIDNARLNVGAATSLYLFALNYNVLRIMSGMGGLAYSN